MTRIIIILALAFITFPAIGQDLKFGPRLGLNFTNTTTNGNSEKIRTRLHLGVFGSMEVAEKVEAQVELLYSQQGTYQIGQVSGPISMNYLVIPLLVKYNIIDKLNVYAGPQIGLGLNIKFKSESTGKVFKIEDVLAPTDIAFLLGAEYEVIEGLRAGTRYFFSLGDTHLDDDKVGKNKVFQITVAYDISNFFTNN